MMNIRGAKRINHRLLQSVMVVYIVNASSDFIRMMNYGREEHKS